MQAFHRKKLTDIQEARAEGFEKFAAMIISKWREDLKQTGIGSLMKKKREKILAFSSAYYAWNNPGHIPSCFFSFNLLIFLKLIRLTKLHP